MTPLVPDREGELTRDVTVEICVDSLELGQAAVRGGADRIELCGPLAGGGTTPSAGLVAAARRAVDVPLAMLVRPRTGPFTASVAEFEVMRGDVLQARDAGVDMVVLGLLRADKTVDVERTRELVELAGPMGVTFHRAFDAARDLEEALRDVMRTGAARILTSGGERNAVLGAPVVRRLREVAAGGMGLMLCGGVSAGTARQSLEVSGCGEVHAALRRRVRRDAATGLLSEAGLEYFAASVGELKAAVTNAAR